MQTILIFSSSRRSMAATGLSDALASAGFGIVAPRGESTESEYQDVLDRFAGTPPDLLFADLSGSVDIQPLRHLRRALREMWGETFAGLPCLALLTTRHLEQPDWPAHTDDFLLPPYAPAEAVARVRLLLFRKRHVRDDNTLAFADLLLDLASERAYAVAALPNAPRCALDLRPREWELLRFLVTHRGKTFSRDRLLDLVWGIDYEGSERTVDIHINRLRTKLPPQAAERLETRRGLGYGFRLPP